MKIRDNLDNNGFLDLSKFGPRRIKDNLEEINEEETAVSRVLKQAEEIQEEEQKITGALKQVEDGKVMSSEQLIKRAKWESFSKLRKNEIIRINELINESEFEGINSHVLRKYLNSLWQT